MILANLVFNLTVVNQTQLPISHGRLLHAAFLKLVQEVDPELSQKMHDSNSNCFSVGMLRFLKVEAVNGTYYLRHGDRARFRIGILSEELLNAVSKFKPGLILRIGKLEAKLDKIISEPEEDKSAVITTIEEVIGAGEYLSKSNRMVIRFETPATFQNFDMVYPFPRPDFIFGSIAERWNQVDQEHHVDVKIIKEIALARLIPDNWQGQTRRINVTPERGLTCFDGVYSFSLKLLPSEYRALFITLAEFGCFCGVGKLTGQGLGQISVEYK